MTGGLGRDERPFICFLSSAYPVLFIFFFNLVLVCRRRRGRAASYITVNTRPSGVLSYGGDGLASKFNIGGDLFGRPMMHAMS